MKTQSKQEVLCIIPARGGSKGIPKKNIQPLLGKPLIAWTIDAARYASSVTRVVVSTDCDEIASVAKHYGAEVVLRPSEISGDLASTETALLQVLETLEKTEQYVPDLLLFMQCTTPFTTSEDIEGTIAAYHREGADVAFAAAPFHYFIWREQDGVAVAVNHEKTRRPMRQERVPEYQETGAVYAINVSGFKKAKHRFFGKVVLYAMPAERCFEIDDPEELWLAERIIEYRTSHNHPS